MFFIILDLITDLRVINLRVYDMFFSNLIVNGFKFCNYFSI